jgi:hypothetical protein
MQVRLPADLHLQMQEASVASDRSLNGEIVNRLRSTFKGKRVRQPSGDPLSTDIMASPRERQLAAQQPGK